VLIDTSALPGLLAAHGVRAEVGTAFGDAELPPGLRSVTGRKNGVPGVQAAVSGGRR
jgi:hypothetical protein